jgi:hypothetical protein
MEAKIGLADKRTLLTIIKWYETYLYSAQPLSSDLKKRLLIVQGLHLRLLRSDSVAIRDDEVVHIQAAITHFTKSARLGIPPSQERDNTLALCEKLKDDLTRWFQRS